jgi:transposase
MPARYRPVALPLDPLREGRKAPLKRLLPFARAGTPWRDVPERYGPWDRVYDLFRRRQRDGTWKRVFTELQAQADENGLITWDVSVDSTVCRAHQHPAGAVKRGISRRNRPAALKSSRTTTGSGAHEAG